MKEFARKFIEPNFYKGLWIAAAALLLTAAILLGLGIKYGLDTYYPWIVLITALSGVVLATLGWIWTGRLQIQMQRDTNALSLLARIHEVDTYDIKEVVYQYILAYEDHVQNSRPAPKLPKKEIEKLLGIYEQLSVAILWGAATEGIIREAQSLVFKRIYTGLKPHIDLVQKDDPRYFEHFESVTCLWFPSISPKPGKFVSRGNLFDPLRDAK